jgi:hypothetical protein
MTKIYRAYYDSKSFSFEAYGQTKTEAIDALVIGLLMHTRQFHAPSDWWDSEGIEVREFTVGFAYRDNEMISRSIYSDENRKVKHG